MAPLPIHCPCSGRGALFLLPSRRPIILLAYDELQDMWEMKGDLVPVAELHSSKDSTEESTYVPWSYRPLETQGIRWYWNKQPYSLKGADAVPSAGIYAP